MAVNSKASGIEMSSKAKENFIYLMVENTKESGRHQKGEPCDVYTHGRHGKGSFVSPHGWTYKGAWKNNCRDGQGTLIYTNGEKYSGSWKDNMVITLVTHSHQREGKGEWTSGDGSSTYKGEWENDRYHNNGTLTLPFEEYCGSWNAGKREGTGIVTYKDGSSYSGTSLNKK